ncbi:ABC transporter substrate-binding protein [Mesorhizobium sp. DCY119]|uniref:ABC transporter substrate-binding protein n=1 Tax=Mesorhizobium sp. DCY119 TaxID=2108445 RepID=UPI001FE1FB78|nr:ABC transporter substrate-binding protein [Mesorhizobium sp. DCY119]
MRQIKSFALAAFAAFGLSSALVAPPAAAESVIRISSPYPATTLDPSRSGAAGNIEPFGQLYSRLLRRDFATGELEGGVAENWDVSADGLTYSLHLRDAQFSDGSPITAEDAAFSLERVRSDKESALPSPLSAVESITASDQKTVVIKLKHALAPMLANLELWNVGIVSKADVDKRGVEGAFSANPLASGPYMVKEWRPGEKLVLTPNPHYWRKGYPKSDATVELMEVAEPETAAAMLKAGEVDVMRSVNWAQVEDLKNTDGIDMRMEPSNVVFITLLNHSREPFSNLKARQAAAYALDNKVLTQAITNGYAKPANTPLPGSLDFHDDAYPGIVADMDKAKKLLEESGMAGKEVKIILGSGSTNQQTGLLMQAQWQAIGLKPVIVNVDTPAWWEATGKGEYDATPTWWMNELTDPDLAVRWALCGSCDSHAFNTFYDNKKVNELTEQGSREQDPKKRAEIYQEIARIATEEVSQIPLYYSPFPIAYSKRLKNLKMTPAMQWTLEETTFAE